MSDNSPLPLVLLPGTLCTAALWEPLFAARPALRGRSLCASFDGHGTMPAAVAHLLATLPPRFAVLGFSLGAIVALALAAAAPERTCGLALVCGNARPDPTAAAPSRKQAIEYARRVGLTTFIQERLWPLYVAPHRLEDETLRTTIGVMAEQIGLDAFADQTALIMSRPDSRPHLHRIDAATLIVSGAQDVLNPEDRQRELYHGIRDATWHAIPDAGHFVPLEAPEALANAVEQWLDTLAKDRV